MQTDVWSDDVLTRHLCFGPLVVDGLAGERVDSDLGDGHGGIFQLTVEPQDLGPFTWVLHHLDEDKNRPDLDDITGTTVCMFQCKGVGTESNIIKFLCFPEMCFLFHGVKIRKKTFSLQPTSLISQYNIISSPSRLTIIYKEILENNFLYF